MDPINKENSDVSGSPTHLKQADGSTSTPSSNDDLQAAVTFSQNWLDRTVEELFHFELSSLGSQVFNANAISDTILALESHEQRIDSLIQSKILLRKKALFSNVPMLYKLSDSVKQSIDISRRFNKKISDLRQTILNDSLVLFSYVYLQHRCQQIHQILVIFHKLKSLECLAEKQFQEKKYELTTSTLLSFQALLSKHEALFKLHSTEFISALLKRHAKAWSELDEHLLNQLSMSLRYYIEGIRRQSALRRINQCLKCLSCFKTKESIKLSVMKSFCTILEMEVHSRLLKYADQGWVKSPYVDIRDVPCQNICAHIPRSEYFAALSGVLELFFNIWITYAELVLWTVKNLSSFQLDLYEELCEKFCIRHEQDQRTALESNQITAVCKNTIEKISDKSSLVTLQEQYLLIILEVFAIQSHCCSFYDFFKIYVILRRFVLEVRTILLKSPNEWETVIAFRDMDPSNVMGDSSPFFQQLLESIERMIKEYLYCFFSERLVDLCSCLREDSWQRLPLKNIDYYSLLVFPSSIPSEWSFLDMVLYDGTVYPAYCLRKNPFSAWNPTPTWLRQYNFVLNDCQKGYKSESSSTWVDENDQSHHIPHSTISHHSPVVSMSAMLLIHTLNHFLQFIFVFSNLKVEVFFAFFLLVDVFICVVCHLFSLKNNLANLIDKLTLPRECCGGVQLQEAHRSFLLQNQSKELVHILRFVINIMKGECSSHISSELIFPAIHTEKVSYHNIFQYLIALMSEILRGFNVEPASCLESPGMLWGLAERVTAVESCETLIHLAFLLFFSPKSKQDYHCWLQLTTSEQEQFALSSYKIREKAVFQLRDFIYTQVVERLFNLKPFILVVRNWKWDSDQQDLGLDVRQLHAQLEDLQRNIACSGGGCIPFKVQLILWRTLAAYAVKCCVEGLSENPQGFPLSQGSVNLALLSLSRLCHEFQVFLLAFSSTIENLHKTMKHEGLGQLPAKYKMDTSYLDRYIEGHSLNGPAAFAWCKLQTDYEVSMLVQLLHKTEHNLSLRKYYVAELELDIASLLNETQKNECSPPETYNHDNTT